VYVSIIKSGHQQTAMQIDHAGRLIFLDEFLSAHLNDFRVSHCDCLPHREGIIYYQDFAVMKKKVDALHLRLCR
jgi:hypothetical protein